MRRQWRSWQRRDSNRSSLTTRIGVAAAITVAATALGVVAATRAPAATVGPPVMHGNLSISKQYFGSTTEPYTGKVTPTFRYTMTNRKGMKIELLSYGAITQAIWLPGRYGHEADVVLGFKTLQDYVNFVSPPVTANGGPYFG
jgi:Aldose 1-epimerase